MTLLATLLINTKMETVLIRGGLLAFSGDDSFSIRAIPHKERTAKMSGKRYNKEVKKQLTMSLRFRKPRPERAYAVFSAARMAVERCMATTSASSAAAAKAR